MIEENKSVTQESLSRLRWQCRRGMLELDLMLQPFVEDSYHRLLTTEQDAFKLLLNSPDQELLEYLMGQKTPGNKDVANVANKVRQAAAN